MKNKLLILFSLVLMSLNTFARSGTTTIDGKNRHWLFSLSKKSPGDSKRYCEGLGYKLVSVKEGFDILSSQQTESGNRLLDLEKQNILIFWTEEQGVSIDAIPIFGILAIPYPGYFHKVVVVYRYHQMKNAIVYDYTNQPMINNFYNYPLCIK